MANQPVNFDVIIIGSGAGGAAAAYSLCKQGFNTCLIERGKQFHAKQDFIMNHADWETRANPLDDAILKEPTIDRGHRTTMPWGDKILTRAPFVYHRVHGLGGSTLHYQGEAHRFAPHTLKTKSLYGWGTDWPIEAADLDSYYSEMESLLGVSGENTNPFKLRDQDFPLPSHGLCQRSQYMAKSAEAAGFSLQANTLAIPSQPFKGRLPCQHSGACNFGCVFEAKSSVDLALVPEAQQTGNLTTLLLSQVTEILSQTEGSKTKISGIKLIENGEQKTLSGKAYVLAAGAVETPRLLLNSQSQPFPNGLANQYDQVGRYFMETVSASLNFELQVDFPVYLGPTLDARVWDFYQPKQEGVSGFVLGLMGILTPNAGPTKTAQRIGLVGRAHKQAMRQRFGKRATLFGISDHLPDKNNRVTLSNNKTDELGMPKVNIESSYSQQDLATIDAMSEKLDQWYKATPNARNKVAFNSVKQASATHVAGTCRMGNEPKESVVDSWGQIWGIENGFIADGSVMPSQGCGDSPSLTIQALALRTAKRVGAYLNSV